MHYAAAHAWDGSPDTLNAAVDKLTIQCKDLGLKPPANPWRDIRKYYQRLQSEGNVDSHSCRAGRPRVMDEKQVRQVISSMKDWEPAGALKPYGSLRTLKKRAPAAAAAIEQGGISDAGVIKRVHKLQPSMKRKKLTIKKLLTPAIMKARVKAARYRKRVPMKHQKAWVYIDAKHIRMEVDEAYGWVDTDEDTGIAAVQHAKSTKTNVPVLCYYIAVGYYVGAMELHYYTGTTGMPATRGGVTFKVSRSEQLVIQLSREAVPLSLPCAICWPCYVDLLPPTKVWCTQTCMLLAV